MWAFSIGTSIGWGSLIVTCNTYLAKAGVAGTILGLIAGMVVILVIAYNLQFMINRCQDAGGIYRYVSNVCGSDHGFLAGWFLLITYISILWANITSVPLFARFFAGDVFRFGLHYGIFGYEVYLGEALLAIAAVAVTGLFCAFCKRAVNAVMIAAAFLFVAGFALCAVLALIYHPNSGFDFRPFFQSDSAAISQIAKIAVISPWAFIGFENIAHFSGEYSFETKKIKKILVASVVMTTAVYICVTLLSVSAYPEEYTSWIDYINDMGSLTGLKAVPAFYAAYHYLGNAGVIILMAALLGAILTSLIGNTLALSRLLYAAGRDESAPGFLGRVDQNGNPSKAVFAVAAVSVFIPFLGRTAIGWIVDVTTLGATLIYALVSYSVYRDAKKDGLKPQKAAGFTGVILMFVFVIMILIPHLLSFDVMESASYILFAIWAVIGLVYFRNLVIRDKDGKYGHSVIVWVILLLFVLFSSMMWVTKETQRVTDETMEEIRRHYSEIAGNFDEKDPEADYLQLQAEKIDNANALFTIASFGIFLLSAAIIISNYQIMKKREEESSKLIGMAEKKATTDELTGVKNRQAYSLKESEMNARIKNGAVEAFSVAVCDVNNLKKINDNEGHKKGDECIFLNCRMICKVFSHSPVYRIGGDEFVVVLEGSDHENRSALVELLNRESDDLFDRIGSSLAVGISDFAKDEDRTFGEVFTRADELMYSRKAEMKLAEAERARKKPD